MKDVVGEFIGTGFARMSVAEVSRNIRAALDYLAKPSWFAERNSI